MNNVDGFKLYCEAFREVFPRSKSREVAMISPSVLDVMAEKLMAAHPEEVSTKCPGWHSDVDVQFCGICGGELPTHQL